MGNSVGFSPLSFWYLENESTRLLFFLSSSPITFLLNSPRTDKSAVNLAYWTPESKKILSGLDLDSFLALKISRRHIRKEYGAISHQKAQSEVQTRGEQMKSVGVIISSQWRVQHSLDGWVVKGPPWVFAARIKVTFGIIKTEYGYSAERLSVIRSIPSYSMVGCQCSVFENWSPLQASLTWKESSCVKRNA